MTADGPARLLAPRSIAVVGATEREGAYGDTLLRNLERLGYDGEIWGVNPKRARIRDVPCVPTLRDLPHPVDAVAVAVPAVAVPDAIDDAVAIGCGGAVVVSAGFGEVESGRRLEERLVATARAASFPVCGPNGNGIVNFPARSGLWGDSVQALPAGGVAMISQSGNVAVNALGSRRGIGFHTVISTGNQAVCDASDWLGALSTADGVRSIAMFLESDGDGERFAAALADCAERGIGVAILKVGCLREGRRGGRRPHRLARRRPADLPVADRGGGRLLGSRPARAPRARPGPRRAARPPRPERRDRLPDLLGRRLRDRRRRGRPDRPRAAGARCRDPRAPRRAPARGRDVRQPARLHVADLGRARAARRDRRRRRRRPGDRPDGDLPRHARGARDRDRAGLAGDPTGPRRRRRPLAGGVAVRIDSPRPDRRGDHRRAGGARRRGRRRPADRRALCGGAAAPAGRPGAAPGDRRGGGVRRRQRPRGRVAVRGRGEGADRSRRDPGPGAADRGRPRRSRDRRGRGSGSPSR